MTLTQIVFIRNNYKQYTPVAMAAQLDLKESQVLSFYKRYGLKNIQEPLKLNYSREPIPVPVKVGKHWPPDHTNKSREDYVAFYLDPNGPTGHDDICMSDADPGL